MPFPLSRTYKIQMNTRYYISGRFSWRNCRNVVSVDSQTLSMVHSGISLRIYFYSLFRICLWPQGNGDLKSGFSLPWLPWLSISIYPEHLVMRRQLEIGLVEMHSWKHLMDSGILSLLPRPKSTYGTITLDTPYGKHWVILNVHR